MTDKLGDEAVSVTLDVLNRGSRLAAILNRRWFAAISNRTIRIARPKAARIAVKALFFWHF